MEMIENPQGLAPQRQRTQSEEEENYRRLSQPTVGFEMYLADDPMNRLPERVVLAALQAGLQFYDPTTRLPTKNK